MLLLDVEKAFDCVLHDALLHELLECRFPMLYVKLIWSFLTDQNLYVTITAVRGLQNVGSSLKRHRVQFSLCYSTIYLLLILVP
jgi:hypothetical protein